MSQLFDEAVQFTDETTGALLDGGLLYIGTNGLDAKLNPITIYPDRELVGTPLANPQTIGSDGRAENKIWVAGKYSFKVENSANVQKYNELENGFDEAVGNTLLVNALGTDDVVVNGSPTVTTLVDSQTYIFTAPATNTGAMTLTIDSTATMDIKKYHDQAILTGDIEIGQKVMVIANLTDSVYELQTDISPVSTIYNTTEIATGDWNMDATAQITKAHGLDIAKIRTIELSIRNDADDLLIMAGEPDISLFSDDTIVTATRLAGGIFDNVSYDATSFNRGHFVIQSIP